MQQNRLKAKGIFLDFDGTLVDSTDTYLKAAEIAFKAIGKQPPAASVALEIPRRVEQRLPLDDLTEGKTKCFMPVYLEAYYTLTETKSRLIPNVCQTLQTLSNRHKLALVTMRHVPNEVVQKELDYLGVSKYFAYVVTGLDTPKPKPSPEALIKCVEALDVDMFDCVIAGDSVNDIRAGKAAGAKTVAVLSGLFLREELAAESPDLILPDITSLPEHVE